MDGGAWRAAVHRVAQSQTQLKRLSMHACIGEGDGNPLQCSCLENPRDGGAWCAAVYAVAWSRTQLKQLSSSSKGTESSLCGLAWLTIFCYVELEAKAPNLRPKLQITLKRSLVLFSLCTSVYSKTSA